MNKTYLLTGGTGFLGSLLAIKLIKNGDNIIFLGRPKNNENFRERIKKTLKSIEPGISLENITTIEIDFQKHNLGINESFRKIDAIWHLAANLSFKKKDREEVFATNVGGVKNVLSLASKINCPVYYTSTAYVHGQRPGKIFENELIKPKKFNNPYEESKFEAEKIVRKWGEKKENKFTIFRLSILIDPSGKLMNIFGYYAMIYSLYRLKKAAGSKKIKIPFLYSKNTFLNLMPVDLAIKWMIEISSKTEAVGKTFHITNPSPFSIKTMAEQTFGPVGIKIFLLKAPLWLVKFYFSLFCFLGMLIPGFKKTAKRISYYKYYMTGCNSYDMKNVKGILGAEKINQVQFAPDFIENAAKEFIKKLNAISES